MTDLARTDDLFFTRTGMDRARVERIVAEALAGMDDGELFLEYSQSESLAFDDGRIKTASFDTARASGCARSPARRSAMPMPPNCPKRRSAAPAARCARSRQGQRRQPGRCRRRAPTASSTPTPIRWAAVDVRGQDQAPGRDRRLCPRQGSARAPGLGLARAASWQAVQIMRPDGTRVADIRPLVRLNVSVVVGEGERMETGSLGRRRPARISPLSSIRRSGGPRSTRRCARRWSISTRCRRRPAR